MFKKIKVQYFFLERNWGKAITVYFQLEIVAFYTSQVKFFKNILKIIFKLVDL